MARTERSCASACAATLAFGRVSITSAPVPTRMWRVTPFSVSSDQTTPTDCSLVIRSPVCARRGSSRPVVVLALDLQPSRAATAPQPHALAILARDDAIAVVLDLMHPDRTGRRDLG